MHYVNSIINCASGYVEIFLEISKDAQSSTVAAGLTVSCATRHGEKGEYCLQDLQFFCSFVRLIHTVSVQIYVFLFEVVV